MSEKANFKQKIFNEPISDRLISEKPNFEKLNSENPITNFIVQYVERKTYNEPRYVNDTYISFDHDCKKVSIVIDGQYTNDSNCSNKFFSVVIDGEVIVNDTCKNLREFVMDLDKYVPREIYEKIKLISEKVRIYPITQFSILVTDN